MMFAHTTSSNDPTDWEPLDDHLWAVGIRASAFAGAFGAGALGQVLGALHDLGKATPEFQGYLAGGPRAPHSAEGALCAAGTFGGLGKLLAFCIAGHHSGLPNGNRRSPGTPAVSLDDRLASAQRLESRLPVPDALQLPFRPGDFFGVQMLVRMLFSCLVDADFLETERFMHEAEGRLVDRTPGPPLAALKAALDAHLDGFDADGGPVNRLRRDVLQAARERASSPPGFFTLTVPTGGGKTLSSLSFALDHALINGMRRVVHVAPFTSIIEQTAGVFRAAVGEGDAVLEHHSAFDWEGLGEDDEARDGAEKLRLAAQNWDHPIVVTTAVQFFESLFANRTSRCRKLHNLVGSVIVLDEAQALPLKVLRPCLAALQSLVKNYRCSVVLCTATQPALRKGDGLDAPEAIVGSEMTEIAPDPAHLYAALRRVRVRFEGVLCDADLAARVAEADQCLTIVNNRAHARALHELISGLPGAGHLTTAMCAAHRSAVLDDIREDLRQGRPVRLIATSLIEAGVDVDFPEVWRATAGIDQIAQAAGRCNREGRLGPEGGKVHVFEPDPAAGHAPPPELRQFAEVARLVLEAHDDPLSLEAVRAYFAELYHRRGPADLDAMPVGLSGSPGILEAIDRSGREGFSFCFADVAHAFRMIESRMQPVIIAEGAHGAPPELIHELRHTRWPGTVARKLQRYLVQVPPRARLELIAAGAVEVVRPQDFGDQFVLLAEPSLYTQGCGLDWSGESDLPPDRLIL